MGMTERSPSGLGQVLTGGVFAGIIAGAATGAIDVLWSWSALSQFLPGFFGKLRFLLFIASSYALAGAAVGLCAAAIFTFYARVTRLGDIVRSAAAAHERARAKHPREALAGLALVIAGVPCVAGALGIAFLSGNAALAERKHIGLVIAVAMGLSLAAVIAGGLLAFALGRLVELGLVKLARSERSARLLSAPAAPAVAAALLVGSAGLVAARASWETLSLLPLRPFVVGLVGACLAVPTSGIGRRLAARWAGGMRERSARGRLRAMAAPIAVAAICLLMLLTGRAESARKAAVAYSGLGGAIAKNVRAAADLDRDGYSAILGGGDCNDWNAAVHPGASEIPDDGVDQNCVGGDATLRRSLDELAFVPVPAAVPRDFSVLLITLDTVRADHLGAYGYKRPTSPAMDAVAREGALFENAWAHAPSTRYSIPAILTGRLPLNVRYDTSIRGWPGLSEENTTIAELMGNAGMSTGAILNYWYFDRERRMDQGFLHYDNDNKRLHRQIPGEGPAKTQGSSSREQTDKAIAFLDARGSERFFLWVHYYDPHYDYERHSEVPSFGDQPIDRYDHEIRYTDLHIGRLIEDLKRRGLYERTIIVITGDHGEGFGEHGIDLHGYHLYAAQTKVPLIIRVPGLAPVRVKMPAGHIDILPTLANLAGLAADAAMMGRSLVDVLAGGEAKDRDRVVFQQLSYEGNHELRGAASSQCHIIYNVSPATSWELYRIDIDPLETRDVIDDPGPCAETRAALEAWYDVSEIPEGAAEALLAEPPAIPQPLAVHFGKEIQLLDVTLPKEPVRRGDSFDVMYTFAANGPLDDDWRVFAHFEGPRNSRFLGDHRPVRPLSWWREGQYIRYSVKVTVPRSVVPGVYQLWMGLFLQADRRPVRSDSARVTIRDNRANVGAVTVK